MNKIASAGLILFCLVWLSPGIGAAEITFTSIVPTNSVELFTIPGGHTELFNGKDFTGWIFCMRSNAEPALAWTVTNGVIHCTGKPTGYLRTAHPYAKYVLTVEWRFVKVAPKADNTGILIHVQPPDQVWPACIQVQGKHDHQGDLIFMAGAEAKEHQGKDANTPVAKQGPANERPVGDWDTVKTVCDGRTVRVWANGKLMNEATGCTVTAGAIGFQSEGAEFEIRKVFLEPLK
jgi:hypothetical protein